MKKLLQFLSIGILSSSVATSVTACNNNEQKNLNKNDEQAKQTEENQNKNNETEQESFKQTKKDLVSRVAREAKDEMDSCDLEQNFEQLKSLETFNEKFKAEIKKYDFYIKDEDKNSANKSNHKDILVKAFFDVKNKIANNKDFSIKAKFILAKNKDECKIKYILEKSISDESVITKEDSVFIKVNKILVNEFKTKLREKLLKTDFQVLRKQIGRNEALRSQSLKRQVQEVASQLNKEKNYDFTLNKINIISVERNTKFSVRILFSKKISNSLCKFNLESFFIFLPFEFK